MTPTEETYSGAGGLAIFFRSWMPEAKPRAVVVICHGVLSHSGYYFWAAEQLVKSGFATYALDMRGRGKSEGERFYVENVAEYVSDVAGVIKIAKSRHPGLPVFLLGHSAGGVVSSVYTLENQAELAGFICESFAFQVPAPGFALAAIKGLSHIAPRLPALKLKNEDFSRDPKAVEAMNADPLIAHEVQPAITVAALVRADERLREEFPLITLPVLIMHGTADKVTVCHGSEFFHQTAGSKDKTLKLYEGHAHDLLADIGKEGVMADITGWIDKRLGADDRRGMIGAGGEATVLTEIATLDAILQAHATQLGDDFTRYRNHCYRVANLCVAQSPDGGAQIEKLAVAVAFHDLGIWTDGTFDYLQPSVRLANAYLTGAAKAEWQPEVSAMVLNHHKISRYRQNPEWLVEPFRRADWIDVTRGVLAFGVPRRTIGKLYEIWPSAGFHRMLVRLELKHLRKHPLNPLPVLRL